MLSRQRTNFVGKLDTEPTLRVISKSLSRPLSAATGSKWRRSVDGYLRTDFGFVLIRVFIGSDETSDLAVHEVQACQPPFPLVHTTRSNIAQGVELSLINA